MLYRTASRVFVWYRLHPDGKRIAVATASYESRDTQDKVVFNFADYLRKDRAGNQVTRRIGTGLSVRR